MDRKIIIEPYRDGDEVGINGLYHEVFGEARDLSAWRWNFAESPIDSRPFILLAKDDGRIVGQYATLASLLKYRDRSAVAMLSVDNMFQPDDRGGIRGVLTRLFARSRKLWTRFDCDRAWGSPNPTAYTIGKRLLEYDRRIEIVNLHLLLSWRAVARKILDVAPVTGLADRAGRRFVQARLAARTRGSNGLEFRRVDTFDARIDEL